jgi:dienelactone hydrolase
MKVLIVLFAIATLLPVHGIAQTVRPDSAPVIRVKPDKALVDEVVSISVAGLAPKQVASVSATMTDNHGTIWQSSAEFIADQKGALELSKQAPARGSYAGTDPMGLFWSMKARPNQPENRASAHTFLAPVIVRFDLEVSGNTVSSASMTRLYIGPGVMASDVRDDGLIARLYEPEKRGSHPGILVLGGSEGGIRSAEAAAALLASHGYAALAVAYFGMESLPPRLVGVPIDYLKKAIDWMGARPTIDRRRLAVIGWSKGGELALMLAAYFPELKAVVGCVPSSVAWQGIGGPGSSWTYRGEPVPYVPFKFMPSSKDSTQPMSLMPSYLASLDNKEAVAKATIPVEKINGPVLVISGKDDQLWPSSVMAEMVMARLKEYRHAYKFVHLACDSAGHAIGTHYSPTTGSTGSSRLNLGGQPAANARAQADSWPRVLQFLKDGLKDAGAR